jgi:DNA helicase-2/ATP-dependent DNA helicase PcrA
MRREGYALDDMVVLYRSHFHAMELQFELTQKQIPYVVTSGVRFFEQAHIKDVSAPLKLFVNGGDELAFDRLLQLFPKVGERTGKRIWEKLGRQVFLRDEQQVEAVAKLLPKTAAEEWGKLASIFAAFEREHLRNNPGEFIHRFVETFYREYAMETFDNYQNRIDDIEALTTYCSRFSSTEDFLNEMALMTNLDAEMEAQIGATDPRKVVRLTTVHQAKGLEWPVVFILWMTDGMFPSMRALEKMEDEEEERRLFYVATTRARDHLFLCVPAMRRTRDGGATSYVPSRFVREIAEQHGLLRTEQIGFI